MFEAISATAGRVEGAEVRRTAADGPADPLCIKAVYVIIDADPGSATSNDYVCLQDSTASGCEDRIANLQVWPAGSYIDTDGGNDTVLTCNSGAYADYVDAGAGNDTVSTFAGADTIQGSSGNDTIRGGDDGVDFVGGDAGDDCLCGGSTGLYSNSDSYSDTLNGNASSINGDQCYYISGNPDYDTASNCDGIDSPSSQACPCG